MFSPKHIRLQVCRPNIKDHRLLIRVVLYVTETEVINYNILRAIQSLSIMEGIHRQAFACSSHVCSENVVKGFSVASVRWRPLDVGYPARHHMATLRGRNLPSPDNSHVEDRH